MEEYFVETEIQSNGEYVVHRQECADMPDRSRCTHLGRYASSFAAMFKAKQFFSSANGCCNCLPECNTMSISKSLLKRSSLEKEQQRRAYR